MAEASCVSDCLPEPPTPISRPEPHGLLRTRQYVTDAPVHTCKHTSVIYVHVSYIRTDGVCCRLPQNILQQYKLFCQHEIIYQLKAIEYLFVFFQLDMFWAYTPIFRSNGCYNFFTYAAYGVLGVARCRS